MKKKIIALCLVVAMAAVAVIGTTLAYFTDTDAKDNTFTVGNVDIELDEQFTKDSKLLPGDTTHNNVQKIVNVKNTGSEDAYVRVHIAIPSALVDQDINAYNDMLHVNFTYDSVADGKWSWKPAYSEGEGWTNNGRANNFVYNTTMNGKDYTVWVVTYRSPLASGATTGTDAATAAIYQVYLDKYVNATADEQGNITYTKPFFTDKQGGTVDPDKTMQYIVANGDKIDIKVFAEGGQAEGFENAYDALNTQFGNPLKDTNYVNPWIKAGLAK